MTLSTTSSRRRAALDRGGEEPRSTACRVDEDEVERAGNRRDLVDRSADAHLGRSASPACAVLARRRRASDRLQRELAAGGSARASQIALSRRRTELRIERGDASARSARSFPVRRDLNRRRPPRCSWRRVPGLRRYQKDVDHASTEVRRLPSSRHLPVEMRQGATCRAGGPARRFDLAVACTRCAHRGRLRRPIGTPPRAARSPESR